MFNDNSKAKRLLVVDDDPLMQSALAIPLRAYFSVEIANNFASGKLALEKSSFDIVLLDCHLPDGSGSNLIPIAHNQESNPVVLMVSGESEINTIFECLGKGASDYVVKDSRLIQELLIRIPMALKRREANGRSPVTPHLELPKKFGDISEAHYQRFIEQCNKMYFQEAFNLSRFEVTTLARALNLSRTTVHARISDLQISKKMEVASR